MKKSISFLLLVFVFLSCSEEVKFNEVALQGLKNNNLWRATEFTAVVATNGSLTLQGTRLDENLSIILNSASKGTYTFSPNSNPKATFTSLTTEGTNIFKTNRSNNYGPGDDIINGSGFVTITSNDGTKISGKFSLELVNEDIESELRKVDFTEGYFNNVPLN